MVFEGLGVLGFWGFKVWEFRVLGAWSRGVQGFWGGVLLERGLSEFRPGAVNLGFGVAQVFRVWVFFGSGFGVSCTLAHAASGLQGVDVEYCMCGIRSLLWHESYSVNSLKRVI